MSKTTPERRDTRRVPGNHIFFVMVDERSYPAELTDISVSGFKAKVNAVTFDEIREEIDGVRFGNMPPLPVAVQWGNFDGSFGATFTDTLMARPIVERIVGINGGSPTLALY